VTRKKTPAKAGKKAPGKRVKAGTSKQEADRKRVLFVEAYLTNGGNATQAAISAGYSEKTADSAGSRLLKDVKVCALLAERHKELTDRFKLTTENVLRETARIAFFDPADCYDEHGALLHPKDMPEDARRAVGTLETVEAKDADGNVYEYTKKVKPWDKNAALERAFKHFGLYKADNEQKPTEARFFYVPAKGPMREAHEKRVAKLAPNQR
jgi:phage terminase small subunit